MSNRRKSHIGVLRNAHDNKDDLNTSAMRKQRRQSIAVHPFISRDTENVVQAQAPKEQPSTPGTTETQKRQSAVPSHRKQRTNLDMTQRYYGDIPNKTPSQISKAISARKKLSNSLLASDISRDDESSVSLFPTQIDPSFSGGSSSSSSSDELNKTTFSDNTEKTASLFVFEATSRLRYSLQGRNNHENDSQDDVGESKVAAVETRPPMMTMTELGKSSHRQSLGSLTRPSAVPGSQMSLLQRRRSLQGQSPDPQTLMGQLSKFKERRLSRQSAGSRRSIGSNVSYRLDEDKDTSMSQGLSNDLLSRFAQNAPESPGKIGAVDVAPKDDGSVASFGSLFEGMSEKETPTDTDFLARTSSVNEVFGELGPHNDNDEDSSTDNFQMTSAGTKLSETNVPASPQESQAARSSSSILGDSPTGSKSISTGQAIGFSSRSSQLGTPAERCSPYKQSPRPLPEAIAFETAFSSQKSDDSVVPSPFKEKTPRSPIDLKRKMSKSPTRMIDSPARNTRSSKRLSKNSAEERRHHQNDENPSTSKSQVAMIDSPARNTRSNKRFSASAEKKRGRDLNFSLDIAESVSKRGRSSGALNSSFRKESSRLFGSARKVAFGSPEVAEFNINSPSVSMTPMPKSANRARSETHNPTVQLENSMAGLLDNLDSHTAVNTSSSTAGSTPFAARRSSDGDIEPLTQDIESNLDEALKQTEDTSNAATEKDPNQDSSNSDMSVELQMEDPTRADESVPHLETNIDDILDSSQDKTVAEKTSYGSDDDASDMSDDSQAANLAGEQTQILEANISELLDGNIEGLPGGFYDGNDEDYTREIEPNMAALLACNASPTQNDKPEQIIFPMEEEITPRAGRASLSSRRLSLEPKSQLSLNVSSDDEEAVERQGLTEVEKEEEPVLDLQINEVLATARASASSPGEVKDIFLKAHIFLQRTNSTVVARMLNDFLECACEENSPFVASKPAELLEDDFLAELSETEKEKLLDLQAHIRSDRREETEKQLGILLEETARSQVFSLENWLVETGHQMEECIAREIDSISLERERVAEEIQLIDDAEQVLSSTKERAVRKARRISLQRRKVCTSS